LTPKNPTAFNTEKQASIHLPGEKIKDHEGSALQKIETLWSTSNKKATKDKPSWLDKQIFTLFKRIFYYWWPHPSHCKVFAQFIFW